MMSSSVLFIKLNLKLHRLWTVISTGTAQHNMLRNAVMKSVAVPLLVAFLVLTALIGACAPPAYSGARRELVLDRQKKVRGWTRRTEVILLYLSSSNLALYHLASFARSTEMRCTSFSFT